MKADRKEIHAIVLDVLMKGHQDDPRPPFKREPIIQAVGTAQFKLLELVPKKVEIRIHERVYIGDGEREQVERVKRRISYEDLTPTARLELPYVIDMLVGEKESEFVQFFNKSISISPKLHMLHLLPGIGKKLMWEILEEREKKPFESYAEITQRIKSIPHPEKMIASRIMEELQDPNVKYHIFTSK
jgi:putative nucleotide binding protein